MFATPLSVQERYPKKKGDAQAVPELRSVHQTQAFRDALAANNTKLSQRAEKLKERIDMVESVSMQMPCQP